MPGSSVHSWLGCFHSSFNTSAAAWEAGTAVFETWLTNGGTPAVLVGQTLGYADTGSNTTWNGFAQTITGRWISVVNGSHPGLIFRLGIPMVASDADWDNLLLGTWDAQFTNFNNYIVAHDGDVVGGAARLMRLRIGWEGNGDWYAWGHRPAANGFTGSTYSTAKYREGWRRIAGLFAGARALGTKLVYSPALPLKNANWATQQWPGLDNAGVPIPGFSLVDVLGGDAYDQFIGGVSVTPQTRWSNMYSGTNGISSLISFAGSHGNLPISFDEWGVDLSTSTSPAGKHSGDDYYYVQQMAQTIQTLVTAGTFDGHVYWDNNNNITSQLSPTTIGPLAAAQFLGVWGNMNSWVVYSKAKKKMFNGTIALGVDVFKILLVQTTSNFQTLTLSTVASLTDQIASAGGYTQVGLPMVVTWTVGASAGAYQFSMAPVIQTATGAGMVNIRAAVIKNSAGQLLCYANITTSQFAVPASTVITLAPTAGGIFTLGSPASPITITPSAGALAIVGQPPVVTNSGGLNVLRSVRTMTNYGPTTPAGFYKEFAAHFKQADVPQNSFVEVRQGDGTTVIPSQGDNFVYWPDNSLRSVSMTMRYALSIATSGSGGLKLYAKTGAFNTTSWATTSAITARDIRLEVTLPTIQTQLLGTANGVTVTYSGTLAGAPLRPSTVSVTEVSGGAGTKVSIDNGSGGWSPAAQIAGGSINYTTGAITITFNGVYVPTTGPVTAGYAVTSNPGTVYTLSANNEVSRATNVRQVRSGPLSAAWKIFGELRNGTGINATPEGGIWGILYLTMFADGTYSVWGQVENGRCTLTTATAKVVLDYKTKDYFNAAVLFDYATTFTLYAGSPVYACSTDGLHYYSGTSVDKCVVAFPVLTLGDSTTTGLYDSYALWWNVSSTAMINAMTISTTSTYFPNSVGDYGDVNSTGIHSYLGQQSSFATAAMLGGSWSALRADRINAFPWATNQISFLDATTGYPANLTNNTVFPGLGTANRLVGWGTGGPNIAISGGSVPAAATGTPPGDGSHCPLYAWYQYLATGQEPWLDMMNAQVVGQLGWGNPQGNATNVTYRNPIINSIQFYNNYLLAYASRALGWNLRNVDHANWLTPDAHPMKPYSLAIETSTLNAMAEWVRPPNSPATMATLGIFDGGDVSGGINSGWMHDFLGMSLATAVRRGRITNSHNFITFHMIPWIIGRHIGGCPWAGCSYRIGLYLPGQNPVSGNPPGYAGASFPQVWSDVWYGSGEPLDAPITTGPGGGSCPTSGLNPASTTWTFANAGNTYACDALVVCMMAMSVGMTNAAAAYTYLENEMIATGLTEAQWAVPASVNFRVDTPR